MKLISIVLILALMFTLCITGAQASPEDQMGQTLNDFSVKTIDGKTFKLSESLKTHELVLINFWATWCGPCCMEFPCLETAWEQYSDRVDVIALSIEAKDNNKTLKNFANDYGLKFSIARDEKKMFDKMGGTAIPTTLIVDRNRSVVAVEIGSKTSAEEFTKLFDSLLETALPKTTETGSTVSKHDTWTCAGCGRTGNTGNYCGGCGHPAPQIVSDNTGALSTERAQQFGRNQYVAAGDLFTVAITAKGTCVATRGAPKVSEWKDMVSICADSDNVAGIRKNGTVVCTNKSFKIGNWKEIIMLDYNSNVFEPDEHIVGLRKDGMVLATGTNRFGECDVTEWENIVDISAGFTHTVGLRSDGTVVATGNNTYGQCNTGDWTDIVDVAAARFSTYGLKNNGKIVATGVMCDFGGGANFDEPISISPINWADVVAIVADNETGAARDYVIGIKKDGTIITNRTELGVYITKEEVASFTNVVSVDCASWGYIVCIDTEGQIFDIGWDADGKRDLSKWSKLKTQ